MATAGNHQTLLRKGYSWSLEETLLLISWHEEIKEYCGHYSRNGIIVLLTYGRNGYSGIIRNIFSFRNRVNRTQPKLINAVFPESYLVISFMVYASHMVNISSIWCTVHDLINAHSQIYASYLITPPPSPLDTSL